MLCRTHIRRGPDDQRRMDLISSGVDGVYGGAPLFMDVTIVSPLHGNGRSMPHSHDRNGEAVARATSTNSRRDYPDVEASPDAQLLSLGAETYDRWSDQYQILVRHLAKFKSENMPDHLKRSIQASCYARWWNLLSVTVQRVVCEGILRDSGHDLHIGAEELHVPPVEELLAGGC